MLLYKGRRAQDTSNERFCCWQVSYHADLACSNFACTGKGMLVSCITANIKKQAPQNKSMPKCLHCSFETQNMSVGRSAGVIHVGTRRGRVKWLPMSARDTIDSFFKPLWLGNLQEKSLP
eukprot:3666960-Amphidinium_carterae.1